MKWGISSYEEGVYDIKLTDRSREWLAIVRPGAEVEVWELSALDVTTLAPEDYLEDMVGSFPVAPGAASAAIAAEIARWLPIVRPAPAQVRTHR